MNLDKRSCLERAKNLVGSSDYIKLRYAALELRQCLEAITYEKLKGAASGIPESIIEKWQPPQAVKTLLEFEPSADQKFVLFAGIEKECGKPSKDMKYVGTHKTFKLKWLRKNYNKLGHLLHYPANNQKRIQKSPEELKNYLSSVISEIEGVLQSNILGGWFGETFSFECVLCKQTVVCSVSRTKKTKKAKCLNPNCGGEYFAEISEDGQSKFKLMETKFDCAECNKPIYLENRHLDIGTRFKCESCGTLHQIISRQWGYGKEIKKSKR